jgi:hypothetical protein
VPGSSIRVLERDENILPASGVDGACLDLGPVPLLSAASSAIASPSWSSVVPPQWQVQTSMPKVR